MTQHDGGSQLRKRVLHPGQLVFQHLQAGHVLLEAGEGMGGFTSAHGKPPLGAQGQHGPCFPVYFINKLIGDTK